VISLYKARLLPALRQTLGGLVSSCWPEVRDALAALVAAIEKAPLAANDFSGLIGAREAFRSFAERRFLVQEGSLSAEAAKEHLDPFQNAVEKSLAPLQSSLTHRDFAHLPSSRTYADVLQSDFRSSSSRLAGASSELHISLGAAPANNTETTTSRPALAAPVGGPAISGSAITTGDTALLCEALGSTRFEMRFSKLPADQTRKAPTNAAQETSKLDLSSLPQPLPLGSGALLRSSARSMLSRSTRPPLATAAPPRGCFYNTASLEYVS